MPPSYFRAASEEGILEWFVALADSSPSPIVAYNFPKMTGFTMSESFVAQLAQHDNVIGFKDSSGDRTNLDSYRRVVPDGKNLFTGDETALWDSLDIGWTGTISGASNCVPQWLSKVVAERDETKFETVLPVIKTIRSQVQPATNKAVLHALGVIATPHPRLPLKAVDPGEVMHALQGHLGITKDNLGF